MATRRKLSTLLGLCAVVTASLFLIAPSPAYADRCEPTELVLRAVFPNYEEPIAEQDSAVCYAMKKYVYPRLCDDQSTLMNCTASINPDPNEPVVIYPYQPEPGRVYCNVRVFAIGGSCTYQPIWP
jgi:hypothetical protein